MGDVRIVRMSTDGIDLVLHQRNQRAHHDGGPLLKQCRELVAQGFAAPRGHDHKNVASFHQAGDNALLLPLEVIEPEKTGKSLLYGGSDQRAGVKEGVYRRLHLTLAYSI